MAVLGGRAVVWLLIALYGLLFVVGPLLVLRCMDFFSKRASRKSQAPDEKGITDGSPSAGFGRWLPPGYSPAPALCRRPADPEAWLLRLKAAYDAGYYHTEEDRERQTGFPWQNKTCKDCPAWREGHCGVFQTFRREFADTCGVFDLLRQPDTPKAERFQAPRMKEV